MVRRPASSLRRGGGEDRLARVEYLWLEHVRRDRDRLPGPGQLEVELALARERGGRLAQLLVEAMVARLHAERLGGVELELPGEPAGRDQHRVDPGVVV